MSGCRLGRLQPAEGLLLLGGCLNKVLGESTGYASHITLTPNPPSGTLQIFFLKIYLYIYLFIYFLLKKARNRNRNL